MPAKDSFKRLATGLAAVAGLAVALPAAAIEIKWTDWIGTTGPTTIVGESTSLGEVIDITYEGTYRFLQTGTGIDYFSPSSPYTDNDVVDNRPPAAEMIAINGGSGALTHTVSFSETVIDPVMAIVSLGQPNLVVTYEFIDETFDILSSGTGHWGGAASGSLFQLTPSILTGVEGHGVIQFSGAYDSISWTVPTFEAWHGFTFGFELLESQAVPEPATLGLLAAGIALVRARRAT